MTKQLAQGYRFLAVGREFRPDPRDRGIQFQLALLDQLQRGHRGKGLGAGKQVDQRVAVPGLLALVVGDASPQIDHRLAADLHTECGAALLGAVEQCGKRIANRFEAKIEITLNLHVATPHV